MRCAAGQAHPPPPAASDAGGSDAEVSEDDLDFVSQYGSRLGFLSALDDKQLNKCAPQSVSSQSRLAGSSCAARAGPPLAVTAVLLFYVAPSEAQRLTRGSASALPLRLPRYSSLCAPRSSSSSVRYLGPSAARAPRQGRRAR